ncbi:MAG: hypothetical protein AB1589_38525 [Cyanobacteriota bacterium]
MALWKQSHQQPFTTYRDPKTGRWLVVKPSQPIEETIVEVPVYRDLETGQWIAVKPTLPPENSFVTHSQ